MPQGLGLEGAGGKKFKFMNMVMWHIKLNGMSSRPGYTENFNPRIKLVLFLFVCFVALRPKSTAMVIAGRSVHLTTLFSWASLNKQLTSNRAHTFACN